jgi:Fe-S-cluster containining protein
MHRRPREEIPDQNPCLRCGACCVGWRASFYWAEADDATEGGVPVGLTVRVDAFRRAMRLGRSGRCVALRGTPGRRVGCMIYDCRPSVCRNFEPAWAGGPAGARCGEARIRLGFPPCGGTAQRPG